MNVLPQSIPEVLVIEPRVFRDDRGFFAETYHSDRYVQAGIAQPFVQDNWSRSIKGTLRGLHFQNPRGQGKLVQVIRGTVFDVAVDVRRGSPTFGQHVAVELSDANARQLWVPPGFAHGFCVVSDEADFVYKCTDLYAPEADAGVLWNDPELHIDWPITSPLLSKKDAALPRLADAKTLPLYAL